MCAPELVVLVLYIQHQSLVISVRESIGVFFPCIIISVTVLIVKVLPLSTPKNFATKYTLDSH